MKVTRSIQALDEIIAQATFFVNVCAYVEDYVTFIHYFNDFSLIFKDH